MKLRDYMKEMQLKIYKESKNQGDHFTFTLFLQNEERMRIACIYENWEFRFDVYTTIYNLEENRTEVIVRNFNEIAKLILEGHTNIDNTVFERFNNVLKWDCLKIIEIDMEG